jgi:zinc/manganese transport system substrate-binding protein
MLRPVLTLSRTFVIFAVAAVVLAACGDDDDGGASGDDGPSVVVTTAILGDIVANIVGDAASVDVVMPAGADPHDFAPSTRQAESMTEADLLVVNGAGFEGGLDAAVETATDGGTAVFTVADHVVLRSTDEGDDPHLWTDPRTMAGAVTELGEALAAVDGIGAGVVTRAEAYAAELLALDAEIEALLADIPTERRVLVTNHEALGYFADRYGFEIIGAVIPSLTTGASASASDIDALAELIEAQGVPAIFAETSSATDLADALADSVGDIAVVSLYTESLGDAGSGADSYIGMLRTDAALLHEALT